MKHLTLACLAGAVLIATPALAQQTQQSSNFVTRQTNNEWRASKLAGVDVYSSDNEKVGTINDVLLKSDGTAGAVVIGSGGVLGAGEKYIAVPYDSLKWSVQGRTIATGGNSMAAAGGNSMAASSNSSGQAVTAAAQGYPDRAILDVSKSAFDSAPTFSYATATSNSGNNGSTRSN